MLTIDSLRAYGADVDAGLARCMGKEDLYLRLCGYVLADTNFEQLSNSLKANDLDAAFEAAHALKGMLGNLELTPMLAPVLEITELLRARTEMDYSKLLGQIAEAKRGLELAAE